ncbi:MAG: hypothetical protein HY583_02725 [Candidatus Omnitrophica bacterium]|nr:hypothetical protein [Candidatus Omnitrophota bacterium]
MSNILDQVCDVNLGEIKKIIEKVRPLALEYQRKTGKPLGITGEVAEFEVARILGLKLCRARQAGYDALRIENGKVIARINIKSKRLADPRKLKGRLGKIDLKKEWDSVIFVVLDENFEVFAIYEAQRKDIEPAITKPGSKSRNERGALAAQQFKSISALRWSKT